MYIVLQIFNSMDTHDMPLLMGELVSQRSKSKHTHLLCAVLAGDSNEISLSVEESNALRAKLGLKPLKIDDDSTKGDDSEGERSEMSVRETTVASIPSACIVSRMSVLRCNHRSFACLSVCAKWHKTEILCAYGDRRKDNGADAVLSI